MRDVPHIEEEFQFDVPDWARDRASKRAITFFLRQSRGFASGAVLLLGEGDAHTALTAIEMSHEALEEAERLLQHRANEEEP